MPNWEERDAKTEIGEASELISMARNRFTWYEFFAGGGMARLGLGPQWECIFANEWCEKKAKAYRSFYGDSSELLVRDVRKLAVKDLPGVPDLVWASFPCQDLSLAGSGAGLQGARSGTFTPFWNLVNGLIAQDRKPKIVVLENVVGAITSHGGKDFATLVKTISESGYFVGAAVINAVHFLPQSRPRLFLIAMDADEKIPSGLASPVHNKMWHPQSLLGAYLNLPRDLKDKWIWWTLPRPHLSGTPSLSAIIEEDPAGVSWHTPEETRRLISLMSKVNREKLERVQHEGKKKVGTIYKRTRPIGPSSKAKRVQRAEIRFDDISGCLRTPVGGSSRQIIMVVEGKRIRSRLLSPREAARLMGVPENYPIPERYNDAYHLFGDGVAVPVVAWIERHILRHLPQRKSIERVA
ncbi:MAG: DNA cytosine methyltransferase [Candidatus Acidiferrum sp.]